MCSAAIQRFKPPPDLFLPKQIHNCDYNNRAAQDCDDYERDERSVIASKRPVVGKSECVSMDDARKGKEERERGEKQAVGTLIFKQGKQDQREWHILNEIGLSAHASRYDLFRGIIA